ncbi:hypothetical protein Landi51_13918 [Colletotrichum acutatum]
MPQIALSEFMMQDSRPLFCEPGIQLETLPYFLNLETPTNQGDKLTTKRNDCALTRLGSLQSDQSMTPSSTILSGSGSEVNNIGFPIREISSKNVGASSDHKQSLDKHVNEGTEDKGSSLTGESPYFAFLEWYEFEMSNNISEDDTQSRHTIARHVTRSSKRRWISLVTFRISQLEDAFRRMEVSVLYHCTPKDFSNPKRAEKLRHRNSGILFGTQSSSQSQDQIVLTWGHLQKKPSLYYGFSGGMKETKSFRDP